MNIKAIGIILAIIAVLGISAGVVYKIIQRAENESQQADSIVNYTFEPHQTFGCASYKVMAEKVKQAESIKAENAK